MRTPLLIACWIGVAVLGVFLRFDDLSGRPFHADEATGARITAQRMASNDYVFDPLHYHGPTLSGAGMVSARVHGMEGWPSLGKGGAAAGAGHRRMPACARAAGRATAVR